MISNVITNCLQIVYYGLKFVHFVARYSSFIDCYLASEKEEGGVNVSVWIGTLLNDDQKSRMASMG